jgi:hypothetical protein
MAPTTTASGAADPGLSFRVDSIDRLLAALVADLEPDRVLGAEAASLYGAFARLERLVVAAKTLLAPRVAASGHWESEGHRSPASLLATLEGVSAGQARRTLETGQRLEALPATEEALRSGTLSGPKVIEITQAASLDPGAEASLLAGADSDSLHVVKERCLRSRATSSRRDPMATYRRIHAKRTFTSWTDAEGAFCFQGRDTAERGALLLARLEAVADRLGRDQAGNPTVTDDATCPTDLPDSRGARRIDALFLLCTARSAVRGSRRSSDPGPTGAADDGPIDDDPSGGEPKARVIVRVDLAALRRGRARPGELCEIDGQGAVPVPIARHLAEDGLLAAVFVEAGDIRAVHHFGRTINARLRTALRLRDRHCVVPGCTVAYGLEIDHVVAMEMGGPTCLDNLALLCHHHHRRKTFEGWQLSRTGPTDEDPGWRFVEQPEFGQEPDLGADSPEWVRQAHGARWCPSRAAAPPPGADPPPARGPTPAPRLPTTVSNHD